MASNIHGSSGDDVTPVDKKGEPEAAGGAAGLVEATTTQGEPVATQATVQPQQGAPPPAVVAQVQGDIVTI